MGDAGFFRGTSSDQDGRFTDKEKKLLKTMKFEDALDTKVDMSRVNLDVMKPWITQKINDILGMEDDVLVEYVISQLELKEINPKVMQINITGFLNARQSREFMAELWSLLNEAQTASDGIAPSMIEKKMNEMGRGGGREKEGLKKEAQSDWSNRFTSLSGGRYSGMKEESPVRERERERVDRGDRGDGGERVERKRERSRDRDRVERSRSRTPPRRKAFDERRKEEDDERRRARDDRRIREKEEERRRDERRKERKDRDERDEKRRKEEKRDREREREKKDRKERRRGRSSSRSGSPAHKRRFDEKKKKREDDHGSDDDDEKKRREMRLKNSEKKHKSHKEEKKSKKDKSATPPPPPPLPPAHSSSSSSSSSDSSTDSSSDSDHQ